MPQQLESPSGVTTPGHTPRRPRRFLWVAVVAVVALAAVRPDGLSAAFERLVRLIGLSGDPITASFPVLSDHEIEQLRHLPAQQQAARLLERSINGYVGANELIEAEIDNWRGELEFEGALENLYMVALNSSNLRVRAAAIEIYLAAFGLPKTTRAVDRVIETMNSEPNSPAWSLWVLGLMANRGVESDRIIDLLLPYVADPDENLRHWAVEALAHTGDERVIPHLLAVFHDDPSHFIRERAACGLAQSGMLTPEQRYLAVPDLLDFTDDPRLDGRTQTWVYQALRDITGETLPNAPSAWRQWWLSAGDRSSYAG